MVSRFLRVGCRMNEILSFAWQNTKSLACNPYFDYNQSMDCTQDFSTYRRHLEIRPVTLSAAKGLARRTKRSFAALRACLERSEGMTARTPLKSTHGSLISKCLLRPSAKQGTRLIFPELEAQGFTARFDKTAL